MTGCMYAKDVMPSKDPACTICQILSNHYNYFVTIPCVLASVGSSIFTCYITSYHNFSLLFGTLLGDGSLVFFFLITTG